MASNVVVFLVAIRGLMSEKLRFSTILGYFERFLAISSSVLWND